MFRLFNPLKRGFDLGAMPSEDSQQFLVRQGYRYRNKRMKLFLRTVTACEGVLMNPEYSLLAFANFSMAALGDERYFEIYAERALCLGLLFHDLLGDPELLKGYLEKVRNDNAILADEVLRWLQDILGTQIETRTKKEGLEKIYQRAMSDLSTAKVLQENNKRLIPNGSSLEFYETMLSRLRQYTELLQARNVQQDWKQGKIRFR